MTRFLLAGLLALSLQSCSATAHARRSPLAPHSAAQESAEQEDFDDFGDFEDFDEFEEEVEETAEVFDPLSGFNRGVFHFNDKFYLWVWKPVALGYAYVFPERVRVWINQVFKTARTPTRFVNALLQLKGKKAGLELGRFLVNATLGVGGLFDAADYLFDWTEPGAEDFGQTLGHYGVGSGFPLVLPFLGPSNLRDGLGIIPDSFAYVPSYFVSPLISLGVTAGERFNRSSLHLGEYVSLKQDALDPYSFIRDAYEQNRKARIED